MLGTSASRSSWAITSSTGASFNTSFRHRAHGDESLLAIDRNWATAAQAAEATKVRLQGDRITAIGKQVDPFDAIDTGVFVFSPAIFQRPRGKRRRRRHLAERRRAAPRSARIDARRRHRGLRVV
jgi:choline kinase